ncbi:MAG TPA: alpha/beta hydrolase [Longimicrobium sp.]|nr:alpha/beta hydrolase [Longimicrobium sp.]
MTEAARRLARTAAEWAGTERVRAGGWNVRYRRAGEGPVIVLVHGLGCSADYWWRNGPALAAAGYTVYAPDLPGFGRTDGPRTGLSVVQQARALEIWADAMALPPAAYVGHSLSCQTALELAATAPARVTALLLAAPTGDRRKRRWLREAVGFVKDTVREPLSLVPIIADAYVRAGVVRWARTWMAGKHHDTFAAAGRVRAPALVLVGDADPVVSVPFAAAVADTLPNGRMEVVPGAAHAIIYDAADAFNQSIARFLASVGMAPAGDGIPPRVMPDAELPRVMLP